MWYYVKWVKGDVFVIIGLVFMDVGLCIGVNGVKVLIYLYKLVYDVMINKVWVYW